MRHSAAWRLSQQALLESTPVILITVAAVKGSAPREVGACMSVCADRTAGTIGGGTLEFRAIEAAREMLHNDTLWLHRQLGLGPALGQCCGGRVELILERLEEADLQWLNPCLAQVLPATLVSIYKSGYRNKSLHEHSASDTRVSTEGQSPHSAQPLRLEQPTHPGYFHLLLFGAGHLGQALVPLLTTLPCSVHWLDPRENALPAIEDKNIRCEWLQTPTLALRDAPERSLVLVMSHSHALDFEICTAALANNNIAWVGMIGSSHKRRQFERHLRKQSHEQATERLQCPIGQRHAALRDPAELAIVLSAAILGARNAVYS